MFKNKKIVIKLRKIFNARGIGFLTIEMDHLLHIVKAHYIGTAIDLIKLLRISVALDRDKFKMVLG
jgi:hypothetical protein